MRPMFSYMGSKWRLSKRYGKPQTGLVIEPFAGAACYSLYWNVPKAILIDLNPYIAGIWTYLINVKESEILSLPVDFDSVDDLQVCQEAKWLIGFWLTKGNVHPNKSRSAWARQYRNSGDCKVWSESVRIRIAKQIPNIRGWQSICGDYRSAPDIEADWFIDAPYVVAGKHYPFSKLNYGDLAQFCRTRKGRVTVCENQGATWLPFDSFISARAMTGKTGARVSHEVIYQQGEPSSHIYT